MVKHKHIGLYLLLFEILFFILYSFISKSFSLISWIFIGCIIVTSMIIFIMKLNYDKKVELAQTKHFKSIKAEQEVTEQEEELEQKKKISNEVTVKFNKKIEVYNYHKTIPFSKFFIGIFPVIIIILVGKLIIDDVLNTVNNYSVNNTTTNLTSIINTSEITSLSFGIIGLIVMLPFIFIIINFFKRNLW